MNLTVVIQILFISESGTEGFHPKHTTAAPKATKSEDNPQIKTSRSSAAEKKPAAPAKATDQKVSMYV